MPVYGEFHGQRLKGFIDRIDSFQPGQARIVDYKTGKVLEDDEDIHDRNAEDIAKKIFAKDVAELPKIALQFYIYDLLMYRVHIRKQYCKFIRIFLCHLHHPIQAALNNSS